MTITRLFFYATFATCQLLASAAWAYPTPDDVPASAASASRPAAKTSPPHAQTHTSSNQAKPSKAKASKGAGSQQASTGDAYSLSHPSRHVDSYQKAVTPPPVMTDR